MPENDFLVIAAAGDANVEDQADYAADPVRTKFFADGAIPDANQHGKMFRQCSAIATMVAQAICDIAGVDMLDDGNSVTQLANMKLMLQKLALFVDSVTMQKSLTVSRGVQTKFGATAVVAAATWINLFDAAPFVVASGGVWIVQAWYGAGQGGIAFVSVSQGTPVVNTQNTDNVGAGITFQLVGTVLQAQHPVGAATPINYSTLYVPNSAI